MPRHFTIGTDFEEPGIKQGFMRIFLFFCISVVAIVKTAGQNDPEAVKILDRFSSAAMAAPSVSMKFDMTTNDQIENTTKTISGSVILSKDKYRLELPDNIIWFNGETSWSYLPAEKEVTITKPDKNDKSFFSQPASIFTMYKEGYKKRLLEERPDGYLIDLYPEDLESDFIRIRLNISKQASELKSLEYKTKGGVTITVNVKYFSLKEKHDPPEFSFQPSKYKDVEVIDMR